MKKKAILSAIDSMEKKNKDFQFRQFSVCQDKCGMKVGTDGVLLGAWAQGGRHILDIGTGTGLIALMMAQRFDKAQVDAIDLDEDACLQASENISDSPFADRIKVARARLQDFQPGVVYDAIVSNPPFFLETLKSPDLKRAQARHADSLPFADLFAGAARLLSETGIFSVIVPAETVEHLMFEAALKRFFLVRRCFVKTVDRKPPKRVLLAFAKHPAVEGMDDCTQLLQTATGERSPWYTELTRDFYIK